MRKKWIIVLCILIGAGVIAGIWLYQDNKANEIVSKQETTAEILKEFDTYDFMMNTEEKEEITSIKDSDKKLDQVKGIKGSILARHQDALIKGLSEVQLSENASEKEREIYEKLVDEINTLGAKATFESLHKAEEKLQELEKKYGKQG